MSTPANPFQELERLFERMQENVEEAARWWETGPADSETMPVQIDLENRDDELVMTADVPGFEADDIDLRVSDRTVELSATHEESDEAAANGEYVRRERRKTSVARSVRLPAAVDETEISATYQHGVLTVHMPKSEPIEAETRIEIE